MEDGSINLFAALFAENYGTQMGVIREPRNSRHFASGPPFAVFNELGTQFSDNAFTNTALLDKYNPPNLAPGRLELSFNRAPQAPGGLILGHDCTCDIILPEEESISPRHCAITFDEDGRLILRDLGSAAGTRVSYHRDDTGSHSEEARSISLRNGEPLLLRRIGDKDTGGDQSRSGFTWILGGDAFIMSQQPSITICIGDNVRLGIVPVKQGILSKPYIQKARSFRQGCNEMAQRFPAHASQSSREDEERLNEVQNPVTVQSSVGSGCFGRVIQYWNASSGKMYAIKQPKDNDYDTAQWRNEITALQRIEHNHITRFEGSILTPGLPPQLWLEYVPYGSLRSQHRNVPISFTEAVIILQQLLSALNYLHYDMKLAHLDIKSDNVLVKWRNSDYISVKLGDFEVAEETMLFTTRCECYYYVSSEVSSSVLARDCQGANDDLCLLGVMIASFVTPGEPVARGWESERKDYVPEEVTYLTDPLASRNENDLSRILLMMTAEGDSLRGPTYKRLVQAMELKDAVLAEYGSDSV